MSTGKFAYEIMKPSWKGSFDYAHKDYPLRELTIIK
jgi:hypothetical protein